jgi:hypothetical protein
LPQRTVKANDRKRTEEQSLERQRLCASTSSEFKIDATIFRIYWWKASLVSRSSLKENQRCVASPLLLWRSSH